MAWLVEDRRREQVARGEPLLTAQPDASTGISQAFVLEMND